jgi:hypothetical protein
MSELSSPPITLAVLASGPILPRVFFKKCLHCQRYIYESRLSEIVFIWQVVRTEGRRQNATTAIA